MTLQFRPNQIRLEAQDDMSDLYLSASRSSDLSPAVIDGHMIRTCSLEY